MGDKNKANKSRNDTKCNLSPHNDQLGENAGEGRMIKAQESKNGK